MMTSVHKSRNLRGKRRKISPARISSSTSDGALIGRQASGSDAKSDAVSDIRCCRMFQRGWKRAVALERCEARGHGGDVAQTSYRSGPCPGRNHGADGAGTGFDGQRGAVIFSYRRSTDAPDQSAAALSALQQLVRGAKPSERPGAVPGKALLVGPRLGRAAGVSL